MSTTPPTDPKNAPDAAKKEINNALLWAVLAAAFAVGMFVYSGKMEVDAKAPNAAEVRQKKNLYLIGGAIGAIIAAVNGYSAYTLSQKAKQPPK